MRTKRINHLSLELRARRREETKKFTYFPIGARRRTNWTCAQVGRALFWLRERRISRERVLLKCFKPSLNVFGLAPFQSICIFEPFCKRLALRKWKTKQKRNRHLIESHAQITTCADAALSFADDACCLSGKSHSHTQKNTFAFAQVLLIFLE